MCRLARAQHGRVDRWLRVATAASLLLPQAACLAHWQDQRLGPREVIQQQQPEVLRVTKVDSTRVVLRDPQLADSVLVGVARDSVLSVPLAEVARVAVRKSGASAPILGIAALVGLGLLIYLVTWDPFEP